MICAQGQIVRDKLLSGVSVDNIGSFHPLSIARITKTSGGLSGCFGVVWFSGFLGSRVVFGIVEFFEVISSFFFIF